MNSFLEMQTGKRRALIKKEARQCLYNDWIMKILSFVITGACFVGVIQFGASLSLAAEGITQNHKLSLLLYFVYILLALVLVVPVVYGLIYSHIVSVTQNKKINLCDLFYAYSDVAILMRSYRLFLYTAIKLFVCFLPALVIDFLCENYYYTGIFGFESILKDFDIVYFVIQSLVVVLLLFGFVMSVKNILGVYVSIKREDKEIGECFFVSRILCEGSKGELALLAVSFLPLMVLSLFTFGFLYVMYTLPYMLITFILYCEFLYNKEMTTHMTKNVLYDNTDENIINENKTNENITNEE